MGGRTIVVESQEGEVVAPGSLRVVSGEGMPFRRDPLSKGRLIVHFNVEVKQKKKTRSFLLLVCSHIFSFLSVP